MKANWLRSLASRTVLRSSLAVLMIVIGLATLSQPIFSDSTRRASAAPAAQAVAPETPQPQAFIYRSTVQGDNLTQVERSDDGGRTWHPVASIPEKVSDVMPVPDDEQVVYARSANAIWVSRDAGATWEHSGQLPSRPMSLAVTSKSTGSVLVGTESVGLAISRDGGETWQVVNDPTLNMSGAAPIAVTALKVNPEDESIVYATTGVWTGTSEARLTPVGTFVSMDGGRLWLQMDQLPINGGPVASISTVEGKPLTVMVDTNKGAVTQEMKMSPELLDELNSGDPAVRASVARLAALLGDTTAVQPLLDHLDDPDMLAGDRAAEALGRLGDQSVAPALMQTLNSDQEDVRARSAYALGLLKHEAAVDMLGERLRTDRPNVARRAAEALANIGTPQALTALTVPLADSEMTPARHAAMSGLEQAGEQAAPELATALQSQNPTLRAHAAEMLGWIRTDGAVQPLAAALKDSDPAVRTQAAWALGEIASPDAQQTLAQAAREVTDDTTKTAVLAAEKRAQATAGARPAAAFGNGLVAALSRVPATSWTFFALFLFLALALLLLTPRRVASVQNRR